jgi:hypothetical protein
MLERCPVPQISVIVFSSFLYRLSAGGGTVFHPILMNHDRNVYPIILDRRRRERLPGCVCAQLADPSHKECPIVFESANSLPRVSHTQGVVEPIRQETPTPHRQIRLSRRHATRSPTFSRSFVTLTRAKVMRS